MRTSDRPRFILHLVPRLLAKHVSSDSCLASSRGSARTLLGHAHRLTFRFVGQSLWQQSWAAPSLIGFRMVQATLVASLGALTRTTVAASGSWPHNNSLKPKPLRGSA